MYGFSAGDDRGFKVQPATARRIPLRGYHLSLFDSTVACFMLSTFVEKPIEPI